MFYSSDLSANDKELSIPVQECIGDIETYFGVENISVLKYDENCIAIPITIKVSIPHFGTDRNIDIRPTEQILIKIPRDEYPHVIPSVLSDRKDFPKAKLSHLYVSKDDKPAALCLVRNDPSEWFANKKMSDLLFVIEEWFFKAAAGLLNDDGEEFDPMRLDGYNGNHIYKYKTLNEIVTDNLCFIPNCNYAILFGSVKNDGPHEKNTLVYKSLSPIPFIQIESLVKVFKNVSKDLDLSTTPERPVFSLLMWAPDLPVENDYWTDLPKDYLSLKVLLNKRGIDIDKMLGTYADQGLHLINGIPLILAIKRPKKMIGYDGEIEFINLGIQGENYKGKKMPDDARVYNLQHIEPFGPELAQMVSGQRREKTLLFIGAGSLGSKMIMHEVRSGNLNLSIVDHDKFLQHNLVRHSLYNNRTGKNKATAIVEEIGGFVKLDKHPKLKAFDKRVIFLTKEEYNEIDWVIDTTASANTQNWISKTDLLDQMSIARCELADDAKLGLMYIEGKERNPRTDDLISLTYYLALELPAIAEWRSNDMKKEQTTLNIGLGCSSTSTVAADDIISVHSGLFSQVLYNEYERKNIGDNGLIFIHKIQDAGLINTSTNNLIIKPFIVIGCGNNSGWEVRIKNDVSETIFALVKESGQNETGGVLVGLANYKTKTIHVLDIIKAPLDSESSPGRFKRGIQDLPGKIEDIKNKTGNMIGYIGEWHSHPMGLDTLSTIDLGNIDLLQAENKKVPIPTCAIIVSNGKILPFVFE